jgi:hypothetical protein
MQGWYRRRIQSKKGTYSRIAFEHFFLPQIVNLGKKIISNGKQYLTSYISFDFSMGMG